MNMTPRNPSIRRLPWRSLAFLFGLALTGVAQPGTPPAKTEPAAVAASWPERRQKIERAWLDLLGDFPKDIPALKPVMRKVTFEPGCPSERLSQQQLAVLKQ